MAKRAVVSRPSRAGKTVSEQVFEDLAHERPIHATCTRCRCPDGRIYPASVAERMKPGPDAFKGLMLCPSCSFTKPISVADLEWLARGAHLVSCAECRAKVGPPDGLLSSFR
jgi:hypothetical protein